MQEVIVNMSFLSLKHDLGYCLYKFWIRTKIQPDTKTPLYDTTLQYWEDIDVIYTKLY